MKRFLTAAAFFAALVYLWHLVVAKNIWSAVLVPDPLDVCKYLAHASADGTLLAALTVTMRRLLLGYIAGVVAGIPIGLLTAKYQWAYDTIVLRGSRR